MYVLHEPMCLSFLCLFFQSERFPADFYLSQAQTSPQKSAPSSFSALSSLQPQQKQRPVAKQLLSAQSEGDLLLAALRQYLSGRLSLHAGGLNPEELEAASPRLAPFYSSGFESPGLKTDTLKSRLLKMGRTPGASVKDPLSTIDGLCCSYYYFMHDVATLEPLYGRKDCGGKHCFENH